MPIFPVYIVTSIFYFYVWVLKSFRNYFELQNLFDGRLGTYTQEVNMILPFQEKESWKRIILVSKKNMIFYEIRYNQFKTIYNWNFEKEAYRSWDYKGRLDT